MLYFSVISIASLLAVFISSNLASIWLWVRARYMLRKLPRSTADSRLLGVTDRFQSPERHLEMTDLMKLGHIVYLRIAWMQTICLTDPHLCMEILEHPLMSKSIRYLYEPFQSLLGSSMAAPDLITAEGGPHDTIWKMLRKGLAPAFSAQNVRKGFGVVCEASKPLAEVLKAKGSKTPVEMSNAFMCITLDSIAQWGFGVDMKAVQSILHMDRFPMVEMISRANAHADRKFSDIPYRLSPWRADYRGGEQACRDFQAIVDDIYQEITTREGSLLDDPSVAGHLLRIRDDNGAPLSPQMIKSQISAIFWAGHDTTGNTMAWCLFAISSNPEVEARVVEELDTLGLLAKAGNPEPRPLEVSDLGKLPYLNAAIKEAMRLYTVVPTVTVRINHSSDTVLSNGFVIPRHTTVCAVLIQLHMNPELFEEPERYNPDRFLEPNAEFIRLESAAASKGGELPAEHATSAVNVEPAELREQGYAKRFIPFSYGRRDCIGQAFSKLSVTSHLARLLGRFHFRLAEERVGNAAQVIADQEIRVTLTPSKGMWMYADPRG